MGSLEELFVRQEVEGNTSFTQIQDWLAGPKRDKDSYRNTAIILSEPFRIREQAEALGESIEDIDAIRDLQNQVNSLGLKEPKTERIVQRKLDIIEELELKEVERQEAKALRRELKEELPSSLRSIKGWETRRGKEAFRAVFI